VQGREHQVPGQRRPDRDLRRLQIARLADQDHVRVLAQERPQRRGEGAADAVVDLNLINSLQVVFDRIFGRHNIVLG